MISPREKKKHQFNVNLLLELIPAAAMVSLDIRHVVGCIVFLALSLPIFAVPVLNGPNVGARTTKVAISCNYLQTNLLTTCNYI